MYHWFLNASYRRYGHQWELKTASPQAAALYSWQAVLWRSSDITESSKYAAFVAEYYLAAKNITESMNYIPTSLH